MIPGYELNKEAADLGKSLRSIGKGPKRPRIPIKVPSRVPIKVPHIPMKPITRAPSRVPASSSRPVRAVGQEASTGMLTRAQQLRDHYTSVGEFGPRRAPVIKSVYGDSINTPNVRVADFKPIWPKQPNVPNGELDDLFNVIPSYFTDLNKFDTPVSDKGWSLADAVYKHLGKNMRDKGTIIPANVINAATGNPNYVRKVYEEGIKYLQDPKNGWIRISSETPQYINKRTGQVFMPDLQYRDANTRVPYITSNTGDYWRDPATGIVHIPNVNNPELPRDNYFIGTNGNIKSYDMANLLYSKDKRLSDITMDYMSSTTPMTIEKAIRRLQALDAHHELNHSVTGRGAHMNLYRSPRHADGYRYKSTENNQAMSRFIQQYSRNTGESIDSMDSLAKAVDYGIKNIADFDPESRRFISQLMELKADAIDEAKAIAAKRPAANTVSGNTADAISNRSGLQRNGNIDDDFIEMDTDRDIPGSYIESTKAYTPSGQYDKYIGETEAGKRLYALKHIAPLLMSTLLSASPNINTGSQK